MTAKFSARVVVFLLAAGVVSPAIAQTGWSVTADYGYTVNVHDDYQSLTGMPTQAGTQFGATVGANGVVNLPNIQPTAQLGGNAAVSTMGVQAKVGSFHLYANADADTSRPQDAATSFQVYDEAIAGVDVHLKDQLTFHSKTSGLRRVNAKWVISKSSVANSIAVGVISPNGVDPKGNHDDAGATAEAWFAASGTGVPQAPQFTLPGGSRYQGNSTNPPWAYNWTTNGGVVEPTIDHVDYDSPSSIDITFDAYPGQHLSVNWTFEVGASARTNDMDNVGGQGGAATGTADFSHTVEWGGITSVVDETTGLPDPDWSVESASGFDYAHPFEAPEPGSLVLAAIGSIAALAIAGRSTR